MLLDWVTPQRLQRLSRACNFRMAGLRLVLDGLADPGNRAAVVRSCEALGLLHVHVVPCSEPPPTLQVRKRHSRAVTTGGDKWIKVMYHKDPADCIASLRSAGFTQILTAKPENPDTDLCHNPIPLRAIDFTHKTALVFGNESRGISPAMSQLCDGDFHIPMVGLTESFNVSVAAGISLHWGRSAREEALGSSSDLTEHEREELLQEYLATTKAMRRLKNLRAKAPKKQVEGLGGEGLGDK